MASSTIDRLRRRYESGQSNERDKRCGFAVFLRGRSVGLLRVCGWLVCFVSGLHLYIYHKVCPGRCQNPISEAPSLTSASGLQL